MSLSLTKSTWSSLEKFFAAQLNAICVQLLRAIDGTGGGNYAPTTAIGIGGQGIKVSATRLLAASESILQFTTPVTAVEIALQDFGDDGGGNVRYPFSSTIAAGAVNRFPVKIPDGVVITGFKVDVVRSAGTPTTEATAVLGYNNMTGSTTSLATQAASAGSGAHTITASGLSHVYSPAARHYFIDVQGEVGGGAANITLTGIRMVVSVGGIPILRGG